MGLDTQVAATRPVVSAPLQTIERSPLRGAARCSVWVGKSYPLAFVACAAGDSKGSAVGTIVSNMPSPATRAFSGGPLRPDQRGKISEPCGQPNAECSGRTRRNVIVAVRVDVVPLVEKVFDVR